MQDVRRFVLLITAIGLGVSCIFSAPSPNAWCGPVSFLGGLGRFDLRGYAGAVLVVLALRGRLDYVLAAVFTLAGAAWAEGAERIHHVWHLPALLLWVEAAPALRDERVRAATIGIWHAHAALSKLQAHGIFWADGRSMAVWLDAFAWPWARRLAQLPVPVLAAAQAAALAIEALAPLAVLPKCRRVVGLALTAFYLAVVVTFPFGFLLNGVLVFIYLVTTQERKREETWSK